MNRISGLSRRWLVGTELLTTPNPLESDRQYDRYYHADLPHLSVIELFVDSRQVDLAIALGVPRDRVWLLARRAALVAEIEARGLVPR